MSAQQRFKTMVISFVISLLFGIVCSDDTQAIVVKQIVLWEMVDSAKYIFSGKCTGREKSFDEVLQRDAYFYTFQVNRMIKGPSRTHLSVKVSKLLVDMKQVPIYMAGDNLVLFLYGESKNGFSSPVGLGQGRFSVRYSDDGTRLVINENNNRNLFKGVSRKTFSDVFVKGNARSKIDDLWARKSGPINYDLFIRLVEAIISSK